MTEIINIENTYDLPSNVKFRGIVAKSDELAVQTFIQHHHYEPSRAWAYQNSKAKTYYFELDMAKERE